MKDAGEVAIRSATRDDIAAIAEVHIVSFRGYVLTRLGKGFLRGYYSTVLDHPHGILLVAEQTGKVVGFAAGFGDPPGFSRLLRSRTAAFLPHILAGLLRNPGIVLIVLQNALGVFRGRPVGYTPDPQDVEFSSVAVVPELQGQGVGRRLIEAFIEEARKQGVPGLYLTTDTDNNDHANRLYQRSGFRLMETFTASGGRRRNLYRMGFDDPHGP